MSKSKLLSFPTLALAIATCGTAFVSTQFAFSHTLADQTLVEWFFIFNAAQAYGTFSQNEVSDAWPWLLARWCGYAGLLAFCVIAGPLQLSLATRLCALLVWKWLDLVLTYRVVKAG